MNKNLNNRHSRGHFTDVNPDIAKYLKQIKRGQGNLLDLGCGLGYMSNTFDKIGFCVVGLDGDSKRIPEAKLKYPNIDFRFHKIETTLPFEDNSFDVVFSRSVFQYIEHEPIIKECKRVLKKDGSIIILENLKNNPITRIGRAYLKLTKHNYKYYPWNHFTLSEISKVKDEFQNSSLHFYHVLSPLAYFKIFKKFYPILFSLDQKLLRLPFLRNFAWLVLLTGKNK